MILSIITINLNNKTGLQRTFESIITQHFSNLETIIIDGGSNDGSIDIIEKYSSHINKWISEKDNGIYDAMNKGIKMASGEYILFLNSGDYLYNEHALSNTFSENPTEDLLFCNVELKTSNGVQILHTEKDNFEFLISGYVVHQGVMFKKSLFEKIGFYNTKLTLAADYEFIIKAIFIYKCSTKISDTVLVSYDGIHGLSSVTENKEALKNQRYTALESVFDKRIINTIKNKDIKIHELMQYKALYIGLLESKSVRLVLKYITLKNKIKYMLGKQ